MIVFKRGRSMIIFKRGQIVRNTDTGERGILARDMYAADLAISVYLSSGVLRTWLTLHVAADADAAEVDILRGLVREDCHA